MRAFETRYKNEMDWLCFTPAQKAEIAQNVAQAVEEQTGKTRGKRRIRRGLVIAVAAVLMAAISFGAVAGDFLLSPSEAAIAVGNGYAKKAFRGVPLDENGPEYQLGDCMVRLCGIATGEPVLDQYGRTLQNEHTYILLTYRHIDGTAFDIEKEYDRWTEKWVFVSGIPINAQPYYAYYRQATVVDGVLYEMWDCSSLSFFSDRTVYLTIFDHELTDLYDQKFPGERRENGSVWASPYEVIQMDEDGSFAFMPDYPKEHLLIELPLDKSTADPERAQEYLESWQYYRDWVDQVSSFEPGYRWDIQSIDDLLESNRPYEVRGHIPTKWFGEK